MRAAIDFAASSAAGDICCGCQDSSTSPSAWRWPIGSQKCSAGPVGPVVRTVSRVIS